jgi:hypothetical protein
VCVEDVLNGVQGKLLPRLAFGVALPIPQVVEAIMAELNVLTQNSWRTP